MTDAELDALVALGEGITPGPWIEGVDGNLRVYGPDGCGEHSGLLATVFKGRGNVRAIAAVPDLIAALTTLRKQRDELWERQRFYGDVVDFAAGHCGPEEAIAFLGDVQADVDGDRLNAWHGFTAFRARQAKGEGQ